MPLRESSASNCCLVDEVAAHRVLQVVAPVDARRRRGCGSCRRRRCPRRPRRGRPVGSSRWASTQSASTSDVAAAHAGLSPFWGATRGGGRRGGVVRSASGEPRARRRPRASRRLPRRYISQPRQKPNAALRKRRRRGRSRRRLGRRPSAPASEADEADDARSRGPTVWAKRGGARVLELGRRRPGAGGRPCGRATPYGCAWTPTSAPSAKTTVCGESSTSDSVDGMVSSVGGEDDRGDHGAEARAARVDRAAGAVGRGGGAGVERGHDVSWEAAREGVRRPDAGRAGLEERGRLTRSGSGQSDTRRWPTRQKSTARRLVRTTVCMREG